VSETTIERLFREAADRLWPDAPALVQEHPVTASGRNYRLDFAVPSLKRGIELDGHATHSSPGAIADDRRKKRALEDAGWQVRYYGGQEVTQDADHVVRDALAWCGLDPVKRESLVDDVIATPTGTLRFKPGDTKILVVRRAPTSEDLFPQVVDGRNRAWSDGRLKWALGVPVLAEGDAQALWVVLGQARTALTNAMEEAHAERDPATGTFVISHGAVVTVFCAAVIPAYDERNWDDLPSLAFKVGYKNPPWFKRSSVPDPDAWATLTEDQKRIAREVFRTQQGGGNT
jgi:hypothetical protein